MSNERFGSEPRHRRLLDWLEILCLNGNSGRCPHSTIWPINFTKFLFCQGSREKGRRGEREKGRRGEREKRRRGEGEKGRRGDGERKDEHRTLNDERTEGRGFGGIVGLGIGELDDWWGRAATLRGKCVNL